MKKIFVPLILCFGSFLLAGCEKEEEVTDDYTIDLHLEPVVIEIEQMRHGYPQGEITTESPAETE